MHIFLKLLSACEVKLKWCLLDGIRSGGFGHGILLLSFGGRRRRIFGSFAFVVFEGLSVFEP
jgi:hypothetical protein